MEMFQRTELRIRKFNKTCLLYITALPLFTFFYFIMFYCYFNDALNIVNDAGIYDIINLLTPGNVFRCHPMISLLYWKRQIIFPMY